MVTNSKQLYTFFVRGSRFGKGEKYRWLGTADDAELMLEYDFIAEPYTITAVVWDDDFSELLRNNFNVLRDWDYNTFVLSAVYFFLENMVETANSTGCYRWEPLMESLTSTSPEILEGICDILKRNHFLFQQHVDFSLLLKKDLIRSDVMLKYFREEGPEKSGVSEDSVEDVCNTQKMRSLLRLFLIDSQKVDEITEVMYATKSYQPVISFLEDYEKNSVLPIKNGRLVVSLDNFTFSTTLSKEISSLAFDRVDLKNKYQTVSEEEGKNLRTNFYSFLEDFFENRKIFLNLLITEALGNSPVFYQSSLTWQDLLSLIEIVPEKTKNEIYQKAFSSGVLETKKLFYQVLSLSLTGGYLISLVRVLKLVTSRSQASAGGMPKISNSPSRVTMPRDRPVIRGIGINASFNGHKGTEMFPHRKPEVHRLINLKAQRRQAIRSLFQNSTSDHELGSVNEDYMSVNPEFENESNTNEEYLSLVPEVERNVLELESVINKDMDDLLPPAIQAVLNPSEDLNLFSNNQNALDYAKRLMAPVSKFTRENDSLIWFTPQDRKKYSILGQSGHYAILQKNKAELRSLVREGRIDELDPDAIMFESENDHFSNIELPYRGQAVAVTPSMHLARTKDNRIKSVYYGPVTDPNDLIDIMTQAKTYIEGAYCVAYDRSPNPVALERYISALNQALIDEINSMIKYFDVRGVKKEHRQLALHYAVIKRLTLEECSNLLCLNRREYPGDRDRTVLNYWETKMDLVEPNSRILSELAYILSQDSSTAAGYYKISQQFISSQIVSTAYGFFDNQVIQPTLNNYRLNSGFRFFERLDKCKQILENPTKIDREKIDMHLKDMDNFGKIISKNQPIGITESYLNQNQETD